MTLPRMIAVLVGGLLLLLVVVVLRAETARLHYEISQCERRADGLRQRLIEAELELARLRSPMGMRLRVEQAAGQMAAPTQPADDSPAEKPRR